MGDIGEIFDVLMRQGILPTAFLIGVIAFFIALLGKLPLGNGYDIPPFTRIMVGIFGFLLACVSIVGVLVIGLTVARGQVNTTPVVVTATIAPNTPFINATISISASPIPLPTFTPIIPTQVPIVLETPSYINGITECELQTYRNSALVFDSDPLEQVYKLTNDLDIYWGRDSSKGDDWSSNDAIRGFTINGAAVFWTNLHRDINTRPNNVQPLLSYEGQGVFFVQAGTSYRIPVDSEGGRYLRVSAFGNC